MSERTFIVVIDYSKAFDSVSHMPKCLTYLMTWGFRDISMH